MLRCLLIAIVLSAVFASYAAGEDTPDAGRVINSNPDWTPRPVEGDVPWYMKETDVEWVDDRLRLMDTGRTWNATLRYAEHGTTPLPGATPEAADGKPAPIHRSFKGTAVRLGEDGEAGMIFDRNQCRWACAWTGDFLHHSDVRFGLLNTPQPAGEVQFPTKPGGGWSRENEEWPEAPSATGPLPRDWANFVGMNRQRDRTSFVYDVAGTRVMDKPWIEHYEGIDVFTRTLAIMGRKSDLQVLICEPSTGSRDRGDVVPSNSRVMREVAVPDGDGVTMVALVGDSARCDVRLDERRRIIVNIPPSSKLTVIKVAIAHLNAEMPESRQVWENAIAQSPPGRFDLNTRPEVTTPVPWTDTLTTQGEVAADDGPLVVDTITIPYDNPYNALFFVSGVDFLPTGELAVSTAHGDVWLVRGVDADLDEIVWKRFATGLYQPLGLKVVDGKVHVLERGQLTRLHDDDNDGTADYYEAVNGDWHVGGGEHSFDTCLETDPDGNWYFHSTGDPHVPTGGTVMKVSADGSTSEVFCTGFRHPIGMGVLPDGRITGADQEGNWMPSTRIDIYRKGGFYGDMRAHHRETPPEIYDVPLCWLPRQLDGSAGGQFTVPADRWGPLGGRTLHMSFGKCRMMLLMMQQIGDVEQAGAVDLGLQFIAGIQRGRFRPEDGHFYVTGMDGWQTAAVVDGCLQRVRYTGQPFRTPLELQVEPTGLRLTFSVPLDPAVAADKERYHIEQWNYHWTAEYGSPRYSVRHPDEEGQDELPIESARVSDDGKEVFLEVPGLGPVMQMQIDYRVEDTEGKPLDGVIYNTIHTTGASD